jgi:cellulose synthase/poly-beta-1,6-N-acetylglucosamine synthase-like glycosyltransferase
VPGAFGAWRRDAVAQVGGVSADTRIEDTDLTLAVAARGWRVVYAPDAVAWTEAPDTLAGLVGQRTRWMSGYLQVIWKYRHLYLRRGTLGWIALPDLAWRNVGSVLLLPLVVPGILRWVETFSWTSLLEVLLGALLIDGLALAAAFLMDRERAASLVGWPLFRLVAPWFFFVVLLRVAWRAGRSVPWARPPRRGWSTPPGGA